MPTYLNITATESINLSGANEEFTFRSGLFAKSLIGNGRSGNIDIVTGELNIDDGAAIEVGNFPSFAESSTEPGTGQPGTLQIKSNSINLDTEGRIDAATQSELGEGANIDLQVADDITLQGDSFISARALNQGNGGNLNIDTGFIVAFSGNNDIIASAEQGEGGNIDINAESVLGIEERLLSPFTNDINASSNLELDGNININTSDINPVQGAAKLTTKVVVPQETAQQVCESNQALANQSEFSIKGKGGVPPAPGSSLGSQLLYFDGEAVAANHIPAALEKGIGEIQLARGMVKDESGRVSLTAYRINNVEERIPSNNSNCGRA